MRGRLMVALFGLLLAGKLLHLLGVWMLKMLHRRCDEVIQLRRSDGSMFNIVALGRSAAHYEAAQ